MIMIPLWAAYLAIGFFVGLVIEAADFNAFRNPLLFFGTLIVSTFFWPIVIPLLIWGI